MYTSHPCARVNKKGESDEYTVFRNILLCLPSDNEWACSNIYDVLGIAILFSFEHTLLEDSRHTLFTFTC